MTLPASRANLLVTGASGSGKSYLAGLVVERLLALDYSVCVIDPEGDYEHLGGLRDTAYLGGEAPDPRVLSRILAHRFGSAVFDTSQVSPEHRPRLWRAALHAVGDARRRTGSPHWLVVDEAHVVFGLSDCACDLVAGAQAGLCLVTYRPSDLCPDAMRECDVVLAAEGGGKRAVASGALVGSEPIPFRVARRARAHVRHEHKYAEARVAPAQRFYFRRQGVNTGRTAANLHELVDELALADVETVSHHLRAGDFSRWIAGVFHDETLAHELRGIETAAASPRAAVAEIIARVRRRSLAAT
jgi:hypothetical protein